MIPFENPKKIENHRIQYNNYKIMKIIEFHTRIMQIMKILKFHKRIIKTMRIIEFHMRIKAINKSIRIIYESYENHLNSIFPV